MTNLKSKIIAILQVLAGIFFLFNATSDIQLGFGVLLLTQGGYNWK